ncbi:hypothetical protein EDD17DRAFT_1751178 [Pisolithus thermaeus]|nr:hypothetical protein EDD17DRAFT_1751178 [Pisolithus thermaeus]
MSKASCCISHSALEGQKPSSTDVTPAPSHSLPAAKSATSGMTSDSNSDQSQLQSYSPSVCDIIEHAKHISHCDIVAVNSFPLHTDFNHKACDYVVEAITECCSKGLLIPDVAKLHERYCKTALGRSQELALLLEEESLFFCFIARKLLEHGDFLKNGVDEEGHTNNLVHPVLSALIIKFFYTGTNAMANIFLEVFQNEIKVALDEIVAKGKEATFKCDVDADVYADVLGLMAKCDMAPVHHAKTKVCCVQWAKVGRGSAGPTTGFDVDLD